MTVSLVSLGPNAAWGEDIHAVIPGQLHRTTRGVVLEIDARHFPPDWRFRAPSSSPVEIPVSLGDPGLCPTYDPESWHVVVPGPATLQSPVYRRLDPDVVELIIPSPDPDDPVASRRLRLQVDPEDALLPRLLT